MLPVVSVTSEDPSTEWLSVVDDEALNKDNNRKRAVFVLNLPSHYHIHIVKLVFTSGYDYFENLEETSVLAKCFLKVL